MASIPSTPQRVTHALRSAIEKRCGRRCPGDASESQAWTASEQPDGFLGFWLSHDFETSAIYLPAAIQYVAARRERWADVLQAAVFCLRSCQAEFEHEALNSLAFDAFSQTLRMWSAEFAPADLLGDAAQTSNPGRGVTSDGTDVDLYLDLLGECKAATSWPALTVVFEKWVADAESPPHCAHVLAFFYRFRQHPPGLSLFQNAHLRRRAFDRTLCARLFNAASPVLQAVLAREELAAVAAMVRGSD